MALAVDSSTYFKDEEKRKVEETHLKLPSDHTS
jgi:hypothetical protein